MSVVEASCPACGGTIRFKIGSSIVTVCEYCNSVVARGDRRLEDLGKVAELVETASPLDIGLRGVYKSVAFELVGRAQLGHQAGGMWEEWYAAFANGRWGWLAEAQGRFYLTFEQNLPDEVAIPPRDALEVGGVVPKLPGSTDWIVAELGEARIVGAKGEIPYRIVPGQTYDYADLSGPHGAFATIDYSETPPSVFAGREVTLTELGISERAAEREARQVAAAHLTCPQCGGALELRAPDQSERVTCPNCGSLLDVNRGQLRFLKALHAPPVKPAINIGSVGTLNGTRLTVIGFMQRSVAIEEVRYFWEEYLLYNPQIGFRWLVESDNHWNFVEPLPPGAVARRHHDIARAQVGRKVFKLFQGGMSRVEYVSGEFYWKVEVGEKVTYTDYIRPPEMLSREASRIVEGNSAAQAAEQLLKPGRKDKTAGQSGEINWSLGTYLPVSDLEVAFGTSGLPRPSGIAPNQLFPYKPVYTYWGMLSAIMVILGLILLPGSSRRQVFDQSYQLSGPPNQGASQVVFSDPFEITARRNIKVSARSSVDNTWLEVEGDFFNEATGLVQQFSLPVAYYHGVEGGESWSEGSQQSHVYLSALPAGQYTLRLEFQRESWQQPESVAIRVEQGVPRLLHWLVAMALLSLVPLVIVWWHIVFEHRRWENSPYGAGEESGPTIILGAALSEAEDG